MSDSSILTHFDAFSFEGYLSHPDFETATIRTRTANTPHLDRGVALSLIYPKHRLACPVLSCTCPVHSGPALSFALVQPPRAVPLIEVNLSSCYKVPSIYGTDPPYSTVPKFISGCNGASWPLWDSWLVDRDEASPGSLMLCKISH